MGRYGVKVDYTCPSCGGEAITMPDPSGGQYARVLVPHKLGCPVSVQVARARARGRALALARREA